MRGSVGLSGRGLKVPWVQTPVWAGCTACRWSSPEDTRGVVSVAKNPPGLDPPAASGDIGRFADMEVESDGLELSGVSVLMLLGR